MTRKSVILRDIHDELGSRSLTASLSDDGTLTIEGQDLGDGVEQCFGPENREYEWAWTIQSSNVPKLRLALDARDDVLAAMAAKFSNDATFDFDAFIEDQDIPYEFWSRIGE